LAGTCKIETMNTTLPRNSHRNKFTGEILAGEVQYCDSCHINFLTTEAGDKHRIGKFGVDRRCISPKEAKLIPLVNKHGSIVWKRRGESGKGYSLSKNTLVVLQKSHDQDLTHIL